MKFWLTRDATTEVIFGHSPMPPISSVHPLGGAPYHQYYSARLESGRDYMILIKHYDYESCARKYHNSLHNSIVTSWPRKLSLVAFVGLWGTQVHAVICYWGRYYLVIHEKDLKVLIKAWLFGEGMCSMNSSFFLQQSSQLYGAYFWRCSHLVFFFTHLVFFRPIALFLQSVEDVIHKIYLLWPKCIQASTPSQSRQE